MMQEKKVFNTMIVLRIDEELKKQLEKEARIHHTSVSGYLRKIIDNRKK